MYLQFAFSLRSPPLLLPRTVRCCWAAMKGRTGRLHLLLPLPLPLPLLLLLPLPPPHYLCLILKSDNQIIFDYVY